MSVKIIKILAFIVGAELILVTVAFIFSRNNPVSHAMLGMGIGLNVLWIITGGTLMFKLRDKVKVLIQKISLDWKLKFILFSTFLALIEEAITTAMTNTAALYGVSMVQAHITASGNYWDVVLTHSVVLIAPIFVIWAWILSKYDFSPNQVFLLFGVTGYILELSHGLDHLIQLFMIFVYGLMIYLPAYSIPAERQAKKPSRWLFIPFIMLGLLGIIPGGVLKTIIAAIRPPHFFPGTD